MTQLDYVDRQILGYLVQDCRTSYREIAKSLGMSATAIKSRVDDMLASGVIIDFIVEFSPAMIGAEVMAIWLQTDGTENKEQFISEIATNRGVIQISLLYGGDYLDDKADNTVKVEFQKAPYAGESHTYTFYYDSTRVPAGGQRWF